MNDNNLGIQDIPLAIYEFRLTPYRDHFAIKNLQTHQFIFIDNEEVELLKAFDQPGTTITTLLQKYQQQFGKFGYKKVIAFIVGLLKSGFFKPESERDLLADKLFQPFKPKRPNRRLVSVSFTGIANRLAPVVKCFDTPASIILFFLFSLSAIYFHQTHYLSVDFLRVNGSYFFGLIFWLVCLLLIISGKNLFKYFLLKSKGLDTPGAGITFRKLVPYFIVFDTDILHAGWQATLRFHLASLFFPGLLAWFGIVFYSVKPIPIIPIFIFTTLLIMFFSISPLLRNELLLALDRLSGKTRLIESMKSFIARKFILRMFSFGSSFPFESHFITFGIFCIVWLFSAYLFAGRALHLYSERLIRAVVFSPHLIDRIAAAIFLCGIVFPFLLVIWYFIKIILINLYTILEKPFDFLLNKIWYRPNQVKSIPQSELVEFLKDIPLCTTIPEANRIELSNYFRLEYFAKHRKVIWQGKLSDGFYVIYRGKAVVIKEEDSGVRTVLAILSEKDSFGEMALIKDISRTATVEAVTPLLCMVLHKDYFKRFIESQHLENKEHITQLIQLTTFLKSLPMFEDIPADVMNRVILESKEKEYPANELVIKQGDPGDEFYIIRTGSVAVWKDYQTPIASQVATLPAGEYFGEIALVEATPRTSSVITREPSRFLVIPKQTLFKILRANVLSGIMIEEAVTKRKSAINKLEVDE
jgi:CRP-like cAMP-binding protein